MGDKKPILWIVLLFGGLFLVFLFLIGSTIVFLRDGLNGTPSGKRIAVVEIEGIISDPTETSRVLRDYEKDDDVKGIILRINSPGGAVGPSQELFYDVLRIRKRKKIVASLGTVAASGAYYIASAADKIVANPGTITGSIGVITQFANIEEVLANLGIETSVYKSGTLKDAGSMLRQPTEADQNLFRSLVDEVFGQFLNDVKTQRHLSDETVALISDGRVVTGATASRLGLVDEIGNMWHSVEVLRELGGIPPDVPVAFPRKKVPFILRGFIEETIAGVITSLRSALGSPQVQYRLPAGAGNLVAN